MEDSITFSIPAKFTEQTEVLLGKTIMALYANEMKDAWEDNVQDVQGRLWKQAVSAHFKRLEPRAYQRTGAMGTEEAVKKTAYLRKPYLGDGRQIILDIETYITEAGILEAHSSKQKTIAELDKAPNVKAFINGKWKKNVFVNSKWKIVHPMGVWAFRIRFPKKNFPLVYPYKTKLDSSDEIMMPNGGVVGSWHKKKTPYLMDYIFAGPNAPNQPLIYRNLGGSGSRTTGEGLDLLNQYLALLGLRKIGALPDPSDKFIEGKPLMDSGSIKSAPVPKFMTELRRQVGEIEINVDFDLDFGDGKTKPVAFTPPKQDSRDMKVRVVRKTAGSASNKPVVPAAPAMPIVKQDIWDQAGKGDLNFSTDID